MEKTTDTTLPGHIQFVLELESEDPQDGDPALVDAVGRDLVEALRREQHTVQLVPTGQKGGNVIMDIWLTLASFLSSAWVQKEVILADGSEIVAILAAGVGLKRFLQKAYEKRAGKNVVLSSPIRLTLEIEGLSIPVEVPDIPSAEALITFAHSLQLQHPTTATQVKPPSKIKGQARIAKRPKSARQ